MARKILTDEIWEKLRILLPQPKGSPGRDDRWFLEAVFWIIRTGAPWRELPCEFGPWKTVYNRYNNRVKQGWSNRISATF